MSDKKRQSRPTRNCRFFIAFFVFSFLRIIKKRSHWRSTVRQLHICFFWLIYSLFLLFYLVMHSTFTIFLFFISIHSKGDSRSRSRCIELWFLFLRFTRSHDNCMHYVSFNHTNCHTRRHIGGYSTVICTLGNTTQKLCVKCTLRA